MKVCLGLFVSANVDSSSRHIQEPHFANPSESPHTLWQYSGGFSCLLPSESLSGASQMKLNPITDNIMNRIHQKMSLEQKIQTLKEDFLDRDQTTFVKIRRTGRLVWESSIPEGTPYSDYMLSPTEYRNNSTKPQGRALAGKFQSSVKMPGASLCRDWSIILQDSSNFPINPDRICSILLIW